jgi:hypothetical protein
MRIIAAVAIALCLLLTGYAAADLRTSDTTTAQTTWHVEYFTENDAGGDPWGPRRAAQGQIESLSATCMVDLEFIPDSSVVSVAWACPD